MKEQIISFEVAKLAKEKGFDCKTIYYYQSQGYRFKIGKVEINHNNVDLIYSAPTQSLLQKWLREKFDIHINLNWNLFGYSCDIGGYNQMTNEEGNVDLGIIGSYEEALEEGLKQALKLIK